MAIILYKRSIYYTSNGSWVWGRWLLFALLILAFGIAIFATNAHRRKMGNKPIVGTSWLAPPPSYGQVAGGRYNPNNPQLNQQPLPLYTENANQNDLGYYDSEGKFVPTSQQSAYYDGFPLGEQAPNLPTSQHGDSAVADDGRSATGAAGAAGGAAETPVARPEPAVTADTTYHRPAGPPPGFTP